MRVGKRPAAADAKKTRSCMVRLEKVKSSPAESPPDEKQFKGPLKKRPLTQFASPPIMTKTKDREKKSAHKFDDSYDMFETPPTIAAGRSRRAIKPNPKYASEDMVTPRIIKNVSVLGSGTKRVVDTERARKQSTSSDDFFNKESSDDLDDVVFQNLEDTGSDVDEKNLDYDSTDMHVEIAPRQRGRPRKNILSQTTYAGSSPNATIRAISNTKESSNAASMQIRKSLTQSINRSSSSTPVPKRKFEHSKDADIASKRFLYASRLAKQNLEKELKEEESHMNVHNQSHSQSRTLETRKSLAGQMPNGSKIIISHNSEDDEVIATVSGTPTSNQNPKTTILRKSPVTRTNSNVHKQRSASPAIRKLKDTTTSGSRSTRGSPSATAASTAVTGGSTEDSEAMPTFTIVNINDIINKKGDALISKSDEKGALPTTLAVVDLKNNNSRRRVDSSPTTNSATDKTDPTKHKKILNHTLLNRSATSLANSRLKISSVSPSKPAPRILNSMVAKKMQPVKPKFANPDDSADESFSLSLEDDDDEADRSVDKSFIGARKVSIFSSTKSSLSPKRENSSVSNNRGILKSGSSSRKTPETVVISRDDGKIIRKVTCFETWYVINNRDKRTSPVERSVLEIPLLELANTVEEIKLPSEKWSHKVTLYELSQAVLAKSEPMNIYTGDLKEHSIAEEDRYKYQVSCVMFRRAVDPILKSRLPYDRAVIFKNKAFFTNIDGKNVKLVGAPSTIESNDEIEILLDIVDSLPYDSCLVEPATTVQ